MQPGVPRRIRPKREGTVVLEMTTPDVSRLAQVGETLTRWQVDGGPVHLHPGDLG
jgi:hypothetical protein